MNIKGLFYCLSIILLLVLCGCKEKEGVITAQESSVAMNQEVDHQVDHDKQVEQQDAVDELKLEVENMVKENRALKKTLESKELVLSEMEAKNTQENTELWHIEQLKKDDPVEQFVVKDVNIYDDEFWLDLDGFYLVSGYLEHIKNENDMDLVLNITSQVYNLPLKEQISFMGKPIEPSTYLYFENDTIFDKVLGSSNLNFVLKNKLQIPITLLCQSYNLKNSDNKMMYVSSVKDIVMLGEENTDQEYDEIIMNEITQYLIGKELSDDTLHLERTLVKDLNNDGAKHYIALKGDNSHTLYYAISKNNNFDLITEFKGQWGYWIKDIELIRLNNSESDYIYCTTTNDYRMSGFCLLELKNNKITQIVEMSNPTGSGYAGLYDEDKDGVYEGIEVYENNYSTLRIGFKKLYDIVNNEVIMRDCIMTSELSYPNNVEDLVTLYFKMINLDKLNCQDVTNFRQSLESNEGVVFGEDVNIGFGYLAFLGGIKVEQISEFNSENQAIYRATVDNSDMEEKKIHTFLVTISKEEEQLKIKAITAGNLN